MAITKTTFTAASLSANEPEVLAFLQANATEYFDEITDADDVISCSIDGVVVLKLAFDGTTKTAISLLNGASYAAGGQFSGEIFRYGFKTNHGIMLETTSNTTYWICKSNNDSTAIIATLATGGSIATKFYIFIGDLVNNSAWELNSQYPTATQGSQTGTAARQKYMANSAAALTSLTALPLGNGGTYAPNLFITCFAENGTITAIKKLVMNGIEYVYDGLFALKE